ncbi:MAG: D-glycero-alpha-D-manno-heptose-1,7-bisphosphate 7-phosphatase [bacterium]
MNKALFLDRDGVLNKYIPNDYTKKLNELKVFGYVFDVLKEFKKRGYKLIVITNQAGINKGIVSYKDFVLISKYLIYYLKLDAIYFCPHVDEDNCLCRKPKNLLLKKAISRFNIDPNLSYFIGDSYRDLLIAKSLNIKFILVLSGQTKLKDIKFWEYKPDYIIKDLKYLKKII